MEEAVEMLLSVDDRISKIVNYPDGYCELFRSRYSRNAFGGPGHLQSFLLRPTLEGLYEAILSEEWNGYYAMTDDAYAAMMAAADTAVETE
jgi:hypothetical protein